MAIIYTVLLLNQGAYGLADVRGGYFTFTPLSFAACWLVGVASSPCVAGLVEATIGTKRNASFAMSKRKAPDDDAKGEVAPPPPPLPPFEDLRAHLEKLQRTGSSSSCSARRGIPTA